MTDTRQQLIAALYLVGWLLQIAGVGLGGWALLRPHAKGRASLVASPRVGAQDDPRRLARTVMGLVLQFRADDRRALESYDDRRARRGWQAVALLVVGAAFALGASLIWLYS
jgi:hypothetical protein